MHVKLAINVLFSTTQGRTFSVFRNICVVFLWILVSLSFNQTLSIEVNKRSTNIQNSQTTQPIQIYNNTEYVYRCIIFDMCLILKHISNFQVKWSVFIHINSSESVSFHYLLSTENSKYNEFYRFIKLY